jgi:hypothetical protein
MSRLDDMIRRLAAQRDVLNALSGRLPPGPILEIGLGSGRTYSHLRQTFPDRRIIAFDRALDAHPACRPAAGDLILGEIAETAPAWAGVGAALVHADIGTAYPEVDAHTLTWLPGLVAALLADGGFAAGGLPLAHPRLAPQPLPPGAEGGRQYLYAKSAG